MHDFGKATGIPIQVSEAGLLIGGGGTSLVVGEAAVLLHCLNKFFVCCLFQACPGRAIISCFRQRKES